MESSQHFGPTFESDWIFFVNFADIRRSIGIHERHTKQKRFLFSLLMILRFLTLSYINQPLLRIVPKKETGYDRDFFPQCIKLTLFLFSGAISGILESLSGGSTSVDSLSSTTFSSSFVFSFCSVPLSMLIFSSSPSTMPSSFAVSDTLRKRLRDRKHHRSRNDISLVSFSHFMCPTIRS